MSKSYGAMSVAQLSVLIQGGAVDPVEVTEAVFDSIAHYADKAVFTTLLESRAMEEARASSRRLREGRSLGLLDGIPIAWKDLFDMEGLPTTAGSVVLAKDMPAKRDAAVVALLRQAGMVAVGRTNMSEFAFSGLGINPHYGTPVNPRGTDLPRIPGGSSSGAGVVVAAGLVPVAMGTDTGGSVRIPAAFNGIVGYKATRGRHAMAGVYPLAKSLDSLGPLCRSVRDAVWIDVAMRGLTAPDVVELPLQGLELIVPENIVFDGAEPGVVAAFEAALERLQKAGAKVARTVIPAFDEIFELMTRYGPLVTAEAFALHRERLAGPDADRMDHRVVMRTRLGSKTTLPDYLAILDARSRLIADVERLVGDRLLAFPTVAHVAPPIGPLEQDDELFFATNNKTLRNTALGNFLDWCGVSIPCGTGEAGMPVGLLLSATTHRDEALLGIALAAEPIIRDDFA
ncbi:amidase [Rhizobium leguminosarum]|uniref:Indoleacetamide hydrolase n=1 Tax=Rhizobium leguminosarum bv. trifolii (strain WSM1325) TaxID=395491 RepID=C6B6M6_RHILS|nr:amidase [Rhizobium leguminosarum]ACS59734.1 Amidase [Rhizobium leguminosarum bv. trifolii WSM1325]MBY2933221.1 amidase [Rhizobium leguminosarum]MBY3021542.1 amidase [Rhizobium leguminosarum]MBY3029709.1 amidase [Rhizobium leguminosarum]RWX29586.1 amidase [Rhizobium leguminosarum]